jgi:hypothetical protein
MRVKRMKRMNIKMMKTNNKTPKCNWCPNDAVQVDYREIDGMTSKILTCPDCFNLSTKFLLKRKYKPRPDSCSIKKKIEIPSISIDHVWYEVHVNATKQRAVGEIFPEYGEVTPEIMDKIKVMVAKMDN